MASSELMCNQLALWAGGVSTRAVLKASSTRKEYRFEAADYKPGLSQGLTGGYLNPTG
jgi:hypothetical protein